MTANHRWAFAAVLFVVVGLIALTFAKAQDAETRRDPARGTWFKSLKQPDGQHGSCCDVSDCHKTQARQLADGSWEAIVEGVSGSKWMAIPPAKVLQHPLSIDGEAYVCSTKGTAGGQMYESNGGMSYMASPSDPVIYCFLPPIPGY